MVFSNRSRISRLDGAITRKDLGGGESTISRAFEANLWHWQDGISSPIIESVIACYNVWRPELAYAAALTEEDSIKYVWLGTKASNDPFYYDYTLCKFRLSDWRIVRHAICDEKRHVYDVKMSGTDVVCILYPVDTDKENLRKYNSIGQKQWGKKIDEANKYPYGLAVDTSGNIYCAIHGDYWSDKCVFKFNGSGTEQWYYQRRYPAYAVDVDGSGNVYVGAYVGDGISFFKLNGSGVKQWDNTTGNHILGVAVDNSGTYLYLCGKRSSNKSIWKCNCSDGVIVDDYDTGTDMNQIRVDPSGDILAVGGQDGDRDNLWKLDDSLNLIYKAGFGCTRGYGLDVDSDGVIMVPGALHGY